MAYFELLNVRWGTCSPGASEDVPVDRASVLSTAFVRARIQSTQSYEPAEEAGGGKAESRYARVSLPSSSPGAHPFPPSLSPSSGFSSIPAKQEPNGASFALHIAPVARSPLDAGGAVLGPVLLSLRGRPCTRNHACFGDTASAGEADSKLRCG